jgi:hypothetical protein
MEKGLEDETGGSGAGLDRSNIEGVVSGPDRSGTEDQLGGAQLQALKLTVADLRGGKGAHEMLGFEAGRLAPGANTVDAHRLSCQRRKGKARPENLASPFPIASVNLDHRISPS